MISYHSILLNEAPSKALMNLKMFFYWTMHFWWNPLGEKGISTGANSNTSGLNSQVTFSLDCLRCQTRTLLISTGATESPLETHDFLHISDGLCNTLVLQFLTNIFSCRRLILYNTILVNNSMWLVELILPH